MTNPITLSPTNGINQTDYLKLFMQELSYQDPLKPVDNRESMAQMAQFSSLQEAKTANETLQLLSGMISANQSLMLLGKHVKIHDSEQEGLVNKIQFSENAPPIIHIAMNGGELQKVKLTDITSVWD